MRKYLLFGSVLFSVAMSGQVTLEHTYSTDSYNDSPRTFAFYTDGGLNYYTVNATENKVLFYNASHVLYKTVTFNIGSEYEVDALILPSDKLFNADAKTEFILVSSRTEMPYDSKMTLFNDDGTNLQEFGDRRTAEYFKTAENTFKLIVSEDRSMPNAYEVYSLPGTLSVLQQQFMKQSMLASPNPASARIGFTNPLLSGESGRLNIYSVSGAKVMEQEVSAGQGNISLDVSALSKGTYFYKLNSHSGKFLKN